MVTLDLKLLLDSEFILFPGKLSVFSNGQATFCGPLSAECSLILNGCTESLRPWFGATFRKDVSARSSINWKPMYGLASLSTENALLTYSYWS